MGTNKSEGQSSKCDKLLFREEVTAIKMITEYKNIRDYLNLKTL